MKILKVEEKKALFRKIDGNYEAIETIDKDQLYNLIYVVIEDGSAEMDDPSTETIVNPAQKIIYESLFNKLIEIKASRATILSSKNKLYNEANEKYKV